MHRGSPACRAGCRFVEDAILNIGQASKAADISMKMVRRYEEQGLLAGIQRGQNGYRSYTESDVVRLRFIKRARMLDFSISQIRELLKLSDTSDRRCSDVLAITIQHARDIESKADLLRETARRLNMLAASCDASDRPDCAIIHSLQSGLGLDASPDDAMAPPAAWTDPLAGAPSPA